MRQGSGNGENGRTSKLDALCKRADEIKAALLEVQSRRRAQERAERQRLEEIIGSAVLDEAADEEAKGMPWPYVREILDKRVTSKESRAFLAEKGWLQR